jgi:hypothetical protein
MATFLPEGGLTWGRLALPFFRSQSATKRSSLPIWTARSTPFNDLPRVQSAWHWTSCGQTRPHTAGRRLVSLMMSTAALKSPSRSFRMKPGMLTATGHPLTQGAFLQFRQRSASSIAWLSE